jgi:uncharacterized OB-fold protein
MSVIRPSDEFLDQPYWRHLAGGRLHLNCCEDCGAARHPPAPICPRCRSFRGGWKPASGNGVLNAFTQARHAVHPLLGEKVPYVITLVDLEEGVRLVSGLPPGRDDQLSVGMKMRCEVVRFDDRFALPYFLPVEDQPA